MTRSARRRMPAVGRGRPSSDAAVYRAAAALPHADRASAVHDLRERLRIMAEVAGATPDWATLAVLGPVTINGADDGLFEWAASVAVPGAVAWEDLPELEFAVAGCSNVDETMPFGRRTTLHF